MRRQRVVMCLAVIAVNLCAHEEAAADDPQLVTALRHERLFQLVGLTAKAESPSPTFSGVGRWFNIDWEHSPGRLSSLTLGVHPTVDLAHAAVSRYIRWQEVAPRSAAPRPVGDEQYLWGNTTTGSLMFRRDNVVVLFNWEGIDEALRVASAMDDLIRTNGEVASRGQFSPAPTIAASGVPETLVLGATAQVQPQITGLPSGKRAWFKLGDERGGGASRVLEVGQKLEVGYAHGGSAGTEHRLLVVLTEENVILSSAVSITYVPRQ